MSAKIVRESEEPDYEWDEEVTEEDFEEIPSAYAEGCVDEINDFIRNCEEPDEEHRGLMAYYYDDPAIREKFSRRFHPSEMLTANS